MDLDEFRVVLESTGVDVWDFIDAAIAVASSDYGHELKDHRDGIVERLYAASATRCRNCGGDPRRIGGGSCDAKNSDEKESSPGMDGSPVSPQSFGRDEDHEDEDQRCGRSIDDEQTKILAIKEHLEDPDQSEDSLVELLQSLADMDITFGALKETDIGRHVNRLRKHSSNDVRRLVKHLVRKWKDLVDEWVKQNTPEGEIASSALIADADSPQQKHPQNGHHQVPDFAYSPNPHNGSSVSDKNNADPEPKSKPMPRREAPPAKPAQQSFHGSASAPLNKQREKDDIDLERLASARKRLQQNYQDAQNAKKQRTIQVMDIHEIPKPKNAFFAKNKGGGGVHGRHW
ncbi:probable mediator of RNA polymerase II transcription subunit 26c [Malania oleifera]|uniref:probable mediator of RNA polymerase II transcription subunit 26c n=1 Tax=Malania oleifera TaxID=397392 RepID=UPI0025AE9067|nr:probable mediator of RNA polymerase II transcription subunit 26c [Malania oleifera]